MNIEFPEGPSGIHPPTAAMQKILHLKGVHNPLTGQPYSEAMLLGIGGGLDAGYILYQFTYLPHPMLVLGFRNQWNNTRAFLENLCARLFLDVQWQEFDQSRAAQQALQEILKSGKLPMVWVDKASLPYQELPASLKGYSNHQVTVYGRDGRLWRLYVDDLSAQLFEVREKALTAARGNLPQNNFLTMVFNRSHKINTLELREGIVEGIRECAAQLNNPVRTIGVSNLENWAEKLVHHANHQGWPEAFKAQKGLYPALRTIYTAIKLEGSEGFALRRLYSDFLHESAGYLGNPGLNAVAGQYLQLSNHWANLAENALPSQIPAFAEVKNLLNKQSEAYRQSDLAAFHQAKQDLQSVEKKIVQDFPLNDLETSELYERLANQVKLISELELSAALRLRDVTHS